MIFIISSVYTKETRQDRINILNWMQTIVASSLEEAIGKYVLRGLTKYPEYTLFQRPTCISIEDVMQAVQAEDD